MLQRRKLSTSSVDLTSCVASSSHVGHQVTPRSQPVDLWESGKSCSIEADTPASFENRLSIDLTSNNAGDTREITMYCTNAQHV